MGRCGGCHVTLSERGCLLGKTQPRQQEGWGTLGELVPLSLRGSLTAESQHGLGGKRTAVCNCHCLSTHSGGLRQVVPRVISPSHWSPPLYPQLSPLAALYYYHQDFERIKTLFIYVCHPELRWGKSNEG